MTGARRMPQDVRERLMGQESRKGHRPTPAAKPTDLGNALRLVARHGDDLLYVYKWGRFMVYDGRRYTPDETGEVPRRAKETVRAIYHEAVPEDGGPIDKELAKHAMRSEAKGRIEAMIALAQSEPGVPVTPDKLDAAPYLLNVLNGTVDLRTGDLRPHDRGDQITKLAPVDYDPDAQAPVFEAFLDRILPSQALRRFVQRAIGYAAAGVVSEEVLVILHGGGANGKSTLVNAVMEVLGEYAIQAAPDLLLAKAGAHPTELADLFGARFVASVETDEGRRLAEGLVKQLTGRDPIRARRMREDFWQFEPTHTAFLSTNHRPDVRGTDHAIWRRIKLVPFEVTIPEDEQDKKLAAKLRAELPGILAWIVRGCLEWQRHGLGEPEEVKAATTSYRDDMDVLAGFIEDRCVVDSGASVGATPLYKEYAGWCEEGGETRLTQTKFGLRLKERGFSKEKAQTVTWYGIGIRSYRPDPDKPRQLDEDPPRHEYHLDTPNTDSPVDSLDSSRPEFDIDTPSSFHIEVIQKTGLQPSNCLNTEAPATRRGRPLSDTEEAEKPRCLGREWSGTAIAPAEVLGEKRGLFGVGDQP